MFQPTSSSERLSIASPKYPNNDVVCTYFLVNIRYSPCADCSYLNGGKKDFVGRGRFAHETLGKRGICSAHGVPVQYPIYSFYCIKICQYNSFKILQY